MLSHRASRGLAPFRAGLLCMMGMTLGLLSTPARAEDAPRPWMPPATDSLVVWAAEARARFATNAGDSVGGPNFLAYQRVGQISRRLVRSFGKDHFLEAFAIKPVMDSLGLSTEVAVDPASPQFVLVVVHNTVQRTAPSVGFLFWYHDQELRYQGTVLDGGWRAKLRVWFSGQNAYPYECGIIHESIAVGASPRFLLLRLAENGMFWNVTQYPGRGPDFGDAGHANWVDVDGDGRPEILSWVPARSDSMFQESSEAPSLLSERLYAERADGFALQDLRLMPSPYSTFQLFVRFLVEGNRAGASRLLATPSKVTEALALGWGVRRKGVAWRYEYGESGEAWPQWIVLRYLAGPGRPQYVVHFLQRDGRWVIQDWIQEVPRAVQRPNKPATPRVEQH